MSDRVSAKSQLRPKLRLLNLRMTNCISWSRDFCPLFRSSPCTVYGLRSSVRTTHMHCTSRSCNIQLRYYVKCRLCDYAIAFEVNNTMRQWYHFTSTTSYIFIIVPQQILLKYLRILHQEKCTKSSGLWLSATLPAWRNYMKQLCVPQTRYRSERFLETLLTWALHFAIAKFLTLFWQDSSAQRLQCAWVSQYTSCKTCCEAVAIDLQRHEASLMLIWKKPTFVIIMPSPGLAAMLVTGYQR